MDKVCLTLDQAKYIYRKVIQDSLINVGTIKQEIEDIGWIKKMILRGKIYIRL